MKGPLPPEASALLVAPTSAPSRWRRRLLWLLALLLGALLLALAGLYWLTSTPEGTRYLLGQLAGRQGLVSYRYVDGDLRHGVTLADFRLRLKTIDITAQRINVYLGWRALLKRDLHFRDANISRLAVIQHNAPTGKPFPFQTMRLPVDLHLDHAQVDEIRIIIPTRPDTVIGATVLNKASWQGTRLTIGADSQTRFAGIQLQRATGWLDFDHAGSWPVNASAQVIVPALIRQGMTPIQLQLGNNLRHTQVQAQTNWPQPLMLQGTAAPFEQNLPYQAVVRWQNQTWPFATAQALRSREGSAAIQGTLRGTRLAVDTWLVGKNVPSGRYQLTGTTDFKAMTVEQLLITALQGKAALAGRVNWTRQVDWQLQGQASQLDIRSLVDPAIGSYLPQRLSGRLATAGRVQRGLWQVGVHSRQPNGETWQLGLAQSAQVRGQPVRPLWIDARWQQLTRQLPTVGLTSSPQGHARIASYPVQVRGQPAGRVNQVGFDARIGRVAAAARQPLILPAGRYQGQLRLQAGQVALQQIDYDGVAGQLGGRVSFSPAASGQPPGWQAVLDARQFNLAQVLPQSSLGLGALTGQVQTRGWLWPDRQQIDVTQVRLQTRLLAQNRPVQLAGQGQVTLFRRPDSPFALRYQGTIDTPGVPTGPMRLQLSGNRQRINVRELVMETRLGGIQLQGLIDLMGGISWDIQARLRDFNTGMLDTRLPGSLTGQVNSSGRWGQGQHAVRFTRTDLRGTLRGQSLQLSGGLNVAFDPARQQQPWRPVQMQADQFVAVWGNNRVQAQGNQQQMNLQVDARQLGALMPGLSGQVQGQVQLGGQNLMDVAADLSISRLRYADVLVGQATLKGTLPALGRQAGRMQLQASAVQIGNNRIDSLQAAVQGTQQAHQADIQLVKQTGQQSTRVQARLAGSLGIAGSWQGTVSDGLIQTGQLQLRQQQPAQVSWQSRERQLNASVHCWQMVSRTAQDSSACLSEPLRFTPQGGNLAVQLKRLDMNALQPFLPPDVVWSGILTGQASIRFAPRTIPQVDALLVTERGQLGVLADDPQDPPVLMPYERLSLKAVTVGNGIQVRFDAKTPTIGTGYIDAVIDPRPTPRTINGALVLDDLQIGVFRPLVPNLRELSGIASLAGGMSGPLTGPDFYGEFRLRDGRLATLDLPLALSNIGMTSSIRGKQASLSGTFNAGEGRGSLTGQASWAGDPRVQLQVQGSQLAVRQPPLLTAFISPDLDFDILPLRRRVSVKGEVLVPRGVISPGDNDENLVGRSADVRVIRGNVDPATLARQQKNLKAAASWQIQTSVDVKLGNAVFFRGFGVNAALDGALAIRQQYGGTLQGRGEISAQRNSQVELYGQTLDLKRALVRFDGALTRPVVDIDANKRVERRLVGVRVTGQPASPRIQVYNDAGLTEQEALNALVTGRISSQSSIVPNTAGFRSDVNNTLAAAGLSLGLSGSRRTTNRIGRSLGLSGLTLDADGSGNDTMLNVTGYITPDLYLRYGVGVFSNTNKLTLRYQVNRRLYLEASSAIDKAIDVFYNWRF